MRYKAVFIAGVAVGFVAGARAGRGAYDKMVGYGQQVAAHPKVQQATSTAQAKATELAKIGGGQGAGLRQERGVERGQDRAGAGRSGAEVRVERQAGGGEQDARRRSGGATDTNPARTARDNAGRRRADGNLVYPADGARPPVNGDPLHYTPDTP